MSLARPVLVVLDSATLGKASRDYWSSDTACREKAHRFVARLQERGVFIALSFTHVIEVLRHENDAIVRDRLRFLQGLPLIAWLRPYDRTRSPGGIPDLIRRELHAVVHDGKRDWRDIIQYVRADLWETGVGSEMFVDNHELWSAVRMEGQRQQLTEQYVASVARTDPGNINSVTVAEIKGLPKRPKSERKSYMRQFAAIMNSQLKQHGDKRLINSRQAAAAFAGDTLNRIDQMETPDGDILDRILEYYGVPHDLVEDHMTVGDIGQLAVYIERLSVLSKDLCPRAIVTVHEVPPDTLPSYVIERGLRKIQRKADRVRGSDLGDSDIAPLVLYADGVEVDKRTHHYLKQVQRACSGISSLMGYFFRSSDYADIPDLLSNVDDRLSR